MTISEHLWNLFTTIPPEKIIGFFYLIGILIYMMYIAIVHKSEFWEAIRGKDGKLEIPELITMLVIIAYINIILADAFLGLKASESVFWSLDAIILFTLTGRVALNRFPGADKPDVKPPIPPPEDKKEEEDPQI